MALVWFIVPGGGDHDVEVTASGLEGGDCTLPLLGTDGHFPHLFISLGFQPMKWLC